MKVISILIILQIFFIFAEARKEVKSDGTTVHMPVNPKSRKFSCNNFLNKREKAIKETLDWCTKDSNSPCVIDDPSQLIPTVLIQNYSEMLTARNLMAKNQLGMAFDSAAYYEIFSESETKFYSNCKNSEKLDKEILVANEQKYGACSNFDEIRQKAIKDALGVCNDKFAKSKTVENDQCAVVLPAEAFPHVALRSVINKFKSKEKSLEEISFFPEKLTLSVFSLPQVNHFKSCPGIYNKATGAILKGASWGTPDSSNAN
jgi:hypothetical protein